VQSGAKGHQWWRRDVYHLRGDKMRTLCGVDCSDWLIIGPIDDVSADCCARCARMAARQNPLPDTDRLNAQVVG
jgi:hypothetical protein